jgi:hypothetical protein
MDCRGSRLAEQTPHEKTMHFSGRAFFDGSKQGISSVMPLRHRLKVCLDGAGLPDCKNIEP